MRAPPGGCETRRVDYSWRVSCHTAASREITRPDRAAWSCLGSARAEGMNDTNARLLHPLTRTHRLLRVMLHTRWSAEAWAPARVEFRKALALRSEIRPA